MGYPILTIAIPTRNRARLLEGLLDRLEAQLQLGVEVFVLNNGSSDDTSKVATRSWVNLVNKHENQGPWKNHRDACTVGSGTYKWVICDDDVIQPHAVWDVLWAVNVHPDIIFSDLGMDAGFSALRYIYPNPRQFILDAVRHAPTMLLGMGGFSHCVFRQSVFVPEIHERKTLEQRSYPHAFAIWGGLDPKRSGVLVLNSKLVTGLDCVAPAADSYRYPGTSDEQWAACIDYINDLYGYQIPRKILTSAYTRYRRAEFLKNPIRSAWRFRKMLMAPGGVASAVRRILTFTP